MVEETFTKLQQRRSSDAQLRRNRLIAGTAYGFIVGLGFSLLVWGYDAYILANSHAAFAWSKFIIGAPLAIIFCTLIGWLGALGNQTWVMVLLWGSAGWILTVLSGHVPFEGMNIALWFHDSRIWGEQIFAYDYAAGVRTTIVLYLNAFVMLLAGLFESTAINLAWDNAKEDARMSIRSWFSLSIGVLAVIIPAILIHYFIYAPMRIPQRSVNEILQEVLTGTSSEISDRSQMGLRSFQPYQESLQDEYELHFLGFSSATSSWHSAYLDVTFEDGFTLRCSTSGEYVVYCSEIVESYVEWMSQLVASSIYGNRSWLDAKIKKLDVDETVVDWLQSNKENISDHYTLVFNGQTAAWVFYTAKFDTGFAMRCRFNGTSPVYVDNCIAVSAE